jgi:hypothetical protein
MNNYPQRKRHKLFILKILLISIFFITALSAESEQSLLRDIETTYSNDFYQDIFYTSKNLTLIDFEHNSTQKKIKEDFEKFLPRYLSTNDFFKDEDSQESEESDFSLMQSHHKFIIVSKLYLNLLSHQADRKKQKALLEKNLLNFQFLMQNTSRMWQYMFSMSLYTDLYSDLECNSKEIYDVLKRYPPPNRSDVFKKLEDEKQWQIDSAEAVEDTDIEKKEFLTQLNQASKMYINRYFDEMATAIKCESRDELKKFNSYIKKEREENMSFWSKVKFTLGVLKAKFFGNKEEGYSYIADFTGKTMALIAVPRLSDLYLNHITIRQQYENILKSNKEAF